MGSSKNAAMRIELMTEARELSTSLMARFDSSPLREVGERLCELLDGAASAVESGFPPEQLRVAIGSVRTITGLLPTSFGSRFMFDAALITQIREEWEEAGAKLSRAIVPRYGSGGWGLCRVPMPTSDPYSAHVMRVLSFPGVDRMSDIDLAEYGWLFHELAHDALYRSGHGFRDTFGSTLSSRVRTLILRGAADSGSAERLSKKRVEMLAKHWQPRTDQLDWSHEIASDVAAVWALGPAFLACFVQLLTSQPERALSAADQHPPYLIRAAALVHAAERLGWADEAWELEEEISAVNGREDLDRSDLVFGDAELIRGAVNAALDSCAALAIPKMTPCQYSELRSVSDAEAVQLSGTALVAVGAIWRRRLDARGYCEWMENVAQA